MKRRRPGGRYEIEHEARWELQVQSKIRSHLNPPHPFPLAVWIGRDAGGEIGGVFVYEELDGPSTVELHYVAISVKHRKQGGGCADELMNVFLSEVTGRALNAGVDAFFVIAWIDLRNRHCQRLFRRFGFQQLAEYPDCDELQRWGGWVPIAGAHFEE